MKNKVYFEPGASIHSSFKSILDYPPEGYEYITEGSIVDQTLAAGNHLLLKYHKTLEWITPLNLSKAWLKGFTHSVPQEAKLIYSYSHPVFLKQPWVVSVEWWHVLIGRNIRHFKVYKSTIERLLSSDYCKGILAWCELDKKAIEANYNCSEFQNKIFIVPLAASPKHFTKQHNTEKIKLLFVGSADTQQDFFLKGGNETILAFIELRKKYQDIELLVRANVPRDLKLKYCEIPNLRIISEIIPKSQLEKEFIDADIFIQPTYDTPFGAFLEAMSYELPVITRNEFANSEIVKDGETGLFVKSSLEREHFLQDVGGYKLLPPTGSAPHANKFWGQINTPDYETVDDLVKKISMLIENPAIMREMGSKARQEIEHGRFSIGERNKILKQIYDGATN